MLRICMPAKSLSAADKVIARPAAVEMMASQLTTNVEVARKIMQGSPRVSIQVLGCSSHTRSVGT